MPHLQITQVVLIHCNRINTLLTTIIGKIRESCKYLFLINHLVNYQIFHPNVLYFSKLLIQNFRILKYGLPIKTLSL